MIITLSLIFTAQDDFNKLFTIAIKLGVIFAVVVLYRKCFIQGRHFYGNLFVGFIPAFVFRLSFGNKTDTLLESPFTVAISLLIGGLVLLKIDNWTGRSRRKEIKIIYFKAFIIRLLQCIAMIPRLSHGSATIIERIAKNLNRKTADEFSFFLTLPTKFGATGKKLLDNYTKECFKNIQTTHQLLRLSKLIATIESKISVRELRAIANRKTQPAFFVDMLAIHSFVAYMSKSVFKWFGYYKSLARTLLIIQFFIKSLNTF